MYKLKYRHQARNYLAKLPFKIKSKIVNKLHEVQENPYDPTLDTDKLNGQRAIASELDNTVLFIRYIKIN